MAKNFREELYNFLSDYINQYDSSPSFSEITAAMGISPRSKSLISRNLRRLENEGKIQLVKEGRSLSIRLSITQVPFLGRISAGSPIEAISEYQYLNMNNLFKGVDRFALIVEGTSMIDEGILDGDIIICRKSETAHEGEIAVVLIENQNTTLKRISYKTKDRVTLIPANSELNPVAYAPEEICIQGIYLGLLRTHGG